MTRLPDFRAYCETACIKLWGEPEKRTAKELLWNGGDTYSARSFNLRQRVWYDHGAQRGGSTLELVAYAKGKPAEELRGAAFFEAWREAHAMELVPDPPLSQKTNGKDDKSILASYPYRNEDNVVLFEVVRFDTNDPDERFRQRQPDGKGGWIWNLKGVRRVLYCLPELIAATKAGERVLVCEGERDVGAAVTLGYAATTMPGGVGKWRDEYDELFRGADVVVVSDNDPQLKDPKTGKLQFHPDGRPKLPGQDHAAKLAKRLSKVAAYVRTVIFPQKDLTEWVEAGGTRTEFDTLIGPTPEREREEEEQQQPTPPQKPLAPGGLEDSVALEFSTMHADHLRYVAVWNRWLEWDGICWRVENTLRAFDLARVLCRSAEDAKHKTVAAVVGLARTDRRQAATVEQWDTNLWLLGTPDGTIDLHTGKMLAAQQDDYITKIVSVIPASEPPALSCQWWLEFLNGVTAGDQELQDFLQRVCGYCLTGLTVEDSLFFLHGLGANGKSVFIRTVSGILADYAKTASMDMFTVTHSERHPTDLAMLRGARLVAAIETEEGRRWDEAKLKALTGGDPIAARFMRQDFFEYVPQFKLLVAGNHKPSFRNVDEAIRRRVKLIPFTVTIPENERDQNFSAKLKEEWPGILRWMIEGCLQWQSKGLKPPDIVKGATESYLTGQDDLQHFIDECCAVAANETDTSAHLWEGWTDWAEDNHEFIGTQRRFGNRLEDKGYKRDREGIARTRIHRGIRCIRENAKKQAAEVRRRADEARAQEAEAKARTAQTRPGGDEEDIPF
jgi:putative DNA primase/helicase